MAMLRASCLCGGVKFEISGSLAAAVREELAVTASVPSASSQPA